MGRIISLVAVSGVAFLVAPAVPAEHGSRDWLMGPPAETDNPWGSYTGFVTAVDGRSITIRDSAQPEFGGGVVRRFRVSADLAAGKLSRLAYENGLRYKLSDVLVGDKVVVRQASPEGRLVCTEIMILRRPGGRVPPDYAPADVRVPWHVMANFYQGLEEQGLPLTANVRRPWDPPPEPPAVIPPAAP